MINIAVDIQICISIEDTKAVVNKDAELHMIKWYIFRGWLHAKDEVDSGLERY